MYELLNEFLKFCTKYFFCLFIYSYVHTLLGSFLPPAPCPFPLPPIPLTSLRNLFCPFLQFCWREDINSNKNDIAFLLVWDKDNYTEGFLALFPCTCVSQPELFHLYQNSSLLDSHLPIVASCQFKITILTPLQWAHQTLSSFGFPTFPYSSCRYSPFSMWPMSNNISAFVLHLKSIYEGEHMIFGLLSLANFA
jgi:hypothetical protein